MFEYVVINVVVEVTFKNSLTTCLVANVDMTKLPADDTRNVAFETMKMSPALQQHLVEQNDPTAGKDGVSCGGV